MMEISFKTEGLQEILWLPQEDKIFVNLKVDVIGNFFTSISA